MNEFLKQMGASFRLASRSEILAWSFGVVRKPRTKPLTIWASARSTLDDEAIFGPKEDFHCMCGFLDALDPRSEYRDLVICPTCGVKYTTKDARRQRFGHIELHSGISHSLGIGSYTLDVVPVLPALYWESTRGTDLAECYETLLVAIELPDEDRVREPLAVLFSLVLEMFAQAYKAHQADAPTLAKGLALIPRYDDSIGPEKARSP